MASAKSVWSLRKIVESRLSFHVDVRVCVWVEIDISEGFLVNIGLRQGCVMSP